MSRKLSVVLLSVVMCLLGVSSALGQSTYKMADYIYATVDEYENATGNTITEFHQSPMLDAQDLPPVEDRLPAEPGVIVPVEGVGQYGGVLDTQGWLPYVWFPWQTYMFRIDESASGVLPDVAKAYEYSEDYKTFTLYLREGVKWSDGEPFTVDDIIFQSEDILWNKELTPVPPEWAAPGDEPAELERIDDYTLRMHFAVPYPSLIIKLAQGGGLQDSFFSPKHYLKNWHIKYNPDADELAQEEGYEHWWEAFNFHKTMFYRSDTNLPSLGPWILEETDPTYRLYVRNPYYHKVDTQGNQLPYIDKIVAHTIWGEADKMKALAGEYDFAADDSIANYPVYKENEEEAGYRIALALKDTSSVLFLAFNQTHPDPVMREIFSDVRFRRAMSLAIDREEIKDAVYLGRGYPTAGVPHPSCSFFKEEWATKWAEYAPQKTTMLLNQMGLDQRDAEGWRLRPDGKTLTILFQCEDAAGVPELVTEYWNAVGVKTVLKQVEASYLGVQEEAGEVDVFMSDLSASTEAALYQKSLHYFRPGYAYGKDWDVWWRTEGEQGEEPPYDVKQFYGWIDEWRTLPYQSSEYIELAQQMFDWHTDNVYVIGLVGGEPFITLFKNLKNTPPVPMWGWDEGFLNPWLPAQWFLEE